MSRVSQVAQASLMAICLLALGCGGSEDGGGDQGGEPSRERLRLHPENPRYLLFRGKPTVLITSGEHYGAVINADFDYERYLDELAGHGFNQTRVFSGSFIEPADKFVVGRQNTLAPRPGRFVSPWARSEDGKFDLEVWNPEYFARLTDFVAEAAERKIVVELVLFSALYESERWEASPFNGANNVNRVPAIDVAQLYTLENGDMLTYQDAFVRKLVDELESFGNVYFEVINEGQSEPAPASDGWQAHIIETIADADADAPLEHLIARNYPHTEPVSDPDPAVSIHNFHYQRDPSRYRNLEGVLAFDETGLQGIADEPYRADGWYFMLSGGGVYSNLDWSFAPDHEDGSFVVPPDTPGGGGHTLRRQLSVLKGFVERFDFVEMSPSHQIVGRAPAGSTVRVLANPGREYAIYVGGGRPGSLALDIPEGRYRAEWISTFDGTVAKRERLLHGGGRASLTPPPHSQDIALALERSP